MLHGSYTYENILPGHDISDCFLVSHIYSGWLLKKIIRSGGLHGNGVYSDGCLAVNIKYQYILFDKTKRKTLYLTFLIGTY